MKTCCILLNADITIDLHDETEDIIQEVCVSVFKCMERCTWGPAICNRRRINNEKGIQRERKIRDTEMKIKSECNSLDPAAIAFDASFCTDETCFSSFHIAHNAHIAQLPNYHSTPF